MVFSCTAPVHVSGSLYLLVPSPKPAPRSAATAWGDPDICLLHLESQTRGSRVGREDASATAEVCKDGLARVHDEAYWCLSCAGLYSSDALLKANSISGEALSVPAVLRALGHDRYEVTDLPAQSPRSFQDDRSVSQFCADACRRISL